MKKVININFQGRVIPIEETAYEILKQYVDSLRRYFSNEEGRDEIVNDIESRIAELFSEALKKGGTCITDDDVNAIIASIGRPEDFDGEEEKVKERVYEQSNNRYTYTKGDRLYRSENEKVIAGVCGGIASYFGVDPLIVRILFIVFALGFGFGFLIYLVLWVALPSTASTVIGSARKRLMRDPDDKIIGGVCKGLSYYFGVNVWIPRALFLIPFFSFVFRWDNWGAVHYPNFFSLSFSPAALIIYIILWLVLPEAKSSSDRLEMKGEKVDLNSIWSNVANETKGMGDRVKKFSQEAADLAAETGKKFGSQSKQFSAEVSQTAKKSGRGFGNLIALLVKIFVYFIVGAVLFAVVAALFTAGIMVMSFLPLFKTYLLTGGWQTIFAWGALLVIWIPVIAIVTSLIRRLAKMKGNSGILRVSFLCLWLLGIASAIALGYTLSQDFKYRSHANEQAISLSNPAVDRLEVRSLRTGNYYNRYNWLHMEPFATIDEDTMLVGNQRIRVVQSPTNNFAVTLLKMSDGASRDQANRLSDDIRYEAVQADSILTLSQGIAINSVQKFRNQQVYVTIAVPIGKRIYINRNAAGWNDNVHVGWDNDNWNNRYHFDSDDEYSWDADVEYVMTKKGLERTTNNAGSEDNNDNEDNDIDQRLEENRRNRENLEQQREFLKQKQQLIDSELNRYHDTVSVPQKTTAIKTASIIYPAASISRILMTKLAM